MTSIRVGDKPKKSWGERLWPVAVLALGFLHVFLIGLVANAPNPDVSSLQLDVVLYTNDPDDHAVVSVGDGRIIPPSREQSIKCIDVCPPFSGWVYYWNKKDLPSDAGDATLIVVWDSTRYEFPVALGHSYSVSEDSLTSGVLTPRALPKQQHWYDTEEFHFAGVGTCVAVVVGVVVMLIAGFREARTWALFLIPYVVFQPPLWLLLLPFTPLWPLSMVISPLAALAVCVIGVMILKEAGKERLPRRRVAAFIIAWVVSLVATFFVTPDIMKWAGL